MSTGDQLLLYMALEQGRSQLCVPLPSRCSSLHLATEQHFVRYFTGGSFIEEQVRSPYFAFVGCAGVSGSVQRRRYVVAVVVPRHIASEARTPA